MKLTQRYESHWSRKVKSQEKIQEKGEYFSFVIWPGLIYVLFSATLQQHVSCVGGHCITVSIQIICTDDIFIGLLFAQFTK